MDNELYENAVGEVQEILENSENEDLTEIKQSLRDANESITEMSETLTELNMTVNNTFEILGAVFILLCIGGIVTTLVKTFFTGW